MPVMRLMTWEDVIATLLTGAIIGVYAAFLNGTSLWLISNARGATAVVLVLGIGVWALRAWRFRTRVRADRDFTAFAITIANLALLAAVIGLITGNTVALTVLVVAAVTLWLIATIWCASKIRPEPVRAHAVQKVTHPSDKASRPVHKGEVSKEHRHSIVKVWPDAAPPAPDQAGRDRAAS